MKQVSIRFAWHDDKWDSGICRDPESNIHCTGNFSLLSSRNQRRIDLNIEDSLKNQTLNKLKKSDTTKERDYLPPCYWCTNAFGNKSCSVKDVHPFTDSRYGNRNDFSSLPKLEHNVKLFFVFSWNFKLGYAMDREIERYVPEKE